MIPLELNSTQQTALANVCSLARGHLYKVLCHHTHTPEELQRIGQEFLDWTLVCHDMGINPQGFDTLYDKLHRSGSNS